MKLSSRTINILKNFSTINNSILIKPGNVIETITKEQNVIGSATVEETFPIEFAIYDLNAFLNAINLVKNPVFEFSEKSVKIVGENSLINYIYCDPRMVPDTIKRKLTLPEPAFAFKLTESTLNETLKASAVIGLPDFTIVGDVETSRLQIILTDNKNPSSNTFAVDLEGKTETSFKYTFKCENLKILPGSYVVEICTKGKQAIGRFKHSSDLSYYIVVEDVA